MQGLVFKPLQECLDGIEFFGIRDNPEHDADEIGEMLLYKGICAGALAALGAVEVAHFLTDDMPEGFMDYQWDEEHPNWEPVDGMFTNLMDDPTREHGYERDLTYPEIMARMYYGHAKADSFTTFDFSTPAVYCEEGDEGAIRSTTTTTDGQSETTWLKSFGMSRDYGVHVYKNAFQMNPTGDLYTDGTFWVHVVHCEIYAEGGPPSDFFFVKSKGLDE